MIPARLADPRPLPQPLTQSRRVLLIRPSALGDVCRTVPLLVRLRRLFPDSQIDWLVQDAFADAIRCHPALTGVVPFPRSDWKRWYTPAAARKILAFAGALRRAGYDLVIDAQGLARSGVLAAATGAPNRFGHADAREGGWIAYTRRVPTAAVHTVERMASLVDAVRAELAGEPASGGAAEPAGGSNAGPAARVFAPTPIDAEELRLHVCPEAAEWAAAHPRLGGRRYAVLAPTSRWPGKRWPADRFAALAGELLRSGAVEMVAVVGSGGERAQCGPVLDLAAREGRVVELFGQTSVAGLMALIQRAALVVANDSAALHMAVGLHRPLVALFGPTDAAKVGPYGRGADVLQRVTPADRLDHKDEAAGRVLMERLSVEEVTAAAAARLGVT